MRLVELEPRWLVIAVRYPPDRARPAVVRHGMGISFLCPHCEDQRLVVMFSNPLDGGPAEALEPDPERPGSLRPTRLWQRNGRTFQSLTLSPSIDVSASGHWHGVIVDGEVRAC
jgi:hypothetical protein